MRGDILDADFIAKLGTFDIVYSWGVLHHTGNMHKAILNALQTLNDSGALFIALYSYSAYMNGTASGRPSPEEWLRIKQRYLNSSRLGRFFMEMEYLWQRYAAPAKGNPRKLLDGIREFHQHWRNYGARSRGMDFWTDIRDWLGGWPMEFVREEELLPQMEEQGLELLRMDTGRGNTEFLFQKRGKGHLWKFALESRALTPLPGPFESMGDHVYKARLPHLRHEANTTGFPLRSRLRVLENGNWLPFANAPLPALRAYAHGRYQHWEDQLYFSAPDNSDPNTNGRTYTYFIDKRE